MTTPKPREFWIFPEDNTDDIFTSKPGMSGEVHVIEHTAFDYFDVLFNLAQSAREALANFEKATKE